MAVLAKNSFSLNIHVPFGDPLGIRVIEKPPWIGKGIIFPREEYDTVRLMKELENVGVYVLWEEVPQGQLSRVYIGESECLKTRLDYQKNKNNKKMEFWTHCVVFFSKDMFLHKTLVKYLESRLVTLAYEANRCVMQGGNVPQEPSLTTTDKSSIDLFLDDMLLCLPAVGVPFFSKPQKPALSSPVLHLSGKGIEATGYEEPDGFTVIAGSEAVKEHTSSLRTRISLMRTDLQKEGILIDVGTILKFTCNRTFKSPSEAACVVLGRPANGRKEWK